MSHLPHRSAVRKDVPLATKGFVAEEIEEALRRDREPDGGGGGEDDAWWLAGIVHTLPCHHSHVLANASHVPQTTPLARRRRAHARTEVVRHPLR